MQTGIVIAAVDREVRMLRNILLGVAMLVLAAGVTADDKPVFEAGVHYAQISKSVPTRSADKIEVVSVFGYLCPHCNNFEPMLQAWEKNLTDEIDYHHIPVVFSRNWAPLARGYYVADMKGLVNETHQAMFDAVHMQNRRFNDENDLAAFYSGYGIDPEEFRKLYNSFAVDTKLNQGMAKVQSYEVTGVPSMVVNGKYRVTASMAGGSAQMLQVVNYLIEKELNSN